MIIQPIPIPMITQTEKPTCPSCKQNESIKEVCNHCGYVYQRESDSILSWVIFILTILFSFILFMVFIFTVLNWATGDHTLIQEIQNTGKYFIKLFNRLW